jgi:hypothetical protein
MGNKVSDEWSVPLCFTHHRALHTVGDEEAWWAEKGIDAKAEALRLWHRSHGIPEPTEVDTLAFAAPESAQASAARQGPDAHDHARAAGSRDVPAPSGERTASPRSESRDAARADAGETSATLAGAGADAGPRNLADVAAE